jgi:hypothetical protein
MAAVCFVLNKLKPAALLDNLLNLGGCWAARSASTAVALALLFLLGPSMMLNNVVNSGDGKINRQSANDTAVAAREQFQVQQAAND